MLTILRDPTGATGRTQHAWDFSLTMQENIALHLRSGGDCELRINGLKVDPLTDPRLDAPPSVLDCVTVVSRPGFGIDAIYYLYAAYAALAVYTLVATRNAASANSTTAKDSPNNSLTAQTNRARTYQAIPDVYGYRRVWPDMIQPSVVEYIDHIKYVTEWLCISRGRGDITAVQYAETPIGDIAGASYEVFAPAGSSNLPELSTTTLSDVLETFASDEVDGQELQPAVPYPEIGENATVVLTDDAAAFTVTVPDGPELALLKGLSPAGTAGVHFIVEAAGSGEDATPGFTFDETCVVTGYTVGGGLCTFTFTAPDPWVIVEGVRTYTDWPVIIRPDGTTYYPIGPFTLPLVGSRIRWNTVFLRGLRGTVVIRMDYWAIDGGGAEISGTRGYRDDSYSSFTYDQQFFTRDLTPSAGTQRYRVQFTRLSTQIGDGSADVSKLEELYAVRHYPTKVLPGVTVIRITTKATAEATGLSERKFNVRWLRHVRVLHNDYDIGPSRNFTRAMGHMWTLAGNPLSELDTDKLAAISSELGADSPLLRFDASLDDSDVSLGSRMQMAADAARCTMWRDGQKWTVTRDQLRSYPELQLDYRNLAASGESSISYAAHLPASNDGVEVEYVDENTQAKKSYVRLNISTGIAFGESANPLKIKMPACTTYSQALNRAQLEARKLIYQRVTVSDTALSDAGSLGMGSLVRWIDPNDFAGDDGLQAGEVMAITGSQILTSEPLDWKGQTSGRITFTGANGQRLGAPVVCTPAAGDAVTLASVPAGLYVRNGTTRQLGSRYAFAVGLTEAEVESAGLYLVTSLKPDGKGNVALTMAEYNAAIYADD